MSRGYRWHAGIIPAARARGRGDARARGYVTRLGGALWHAGRSRGNLGHRMRGYRPGGLSVGSALVHAATVRAYM